MLFIFCLKREENLSTFSLVNRPDHRLDATIRRNRVQMTLHSAENKFNRKTKIRPPACGRRGGGC